MRRPRVPSRRLDAAACCAGSATTGTSLYRHIFKPVIAARVRCVVVGRALERSAPVLYYFLSDLARDNELTFRAGRKRAPG